MAYNANIPQPADQLSQSQPQLLANFQAISTLINVNHNDFSSPNQGKHFFVEFPVQSGDQVTIASEMGMYAKTSALTGIPALFLRKDTNGLVTEWTSYFNDASDNGWTRLPSNILLKWGVASVGAISPQTITFPVGGSIPAFSSLFFALVEPEPIGLGTDPGTSAYPNIVLSSPTVLNLVLCNRVTGANASGNVYYFALGI
jgi:hypothetical protein